MVLPAAGLGEGTGPAQSRLRVNFSSAPWALTHLPGHPPGQEGGTSSGSLRVSEDEPAGGASLASDLCPPPSSLQSSGPFPGGTCWDGGGWSEQGGDFCSDTFQVARGSRDDSSPQEPCYLLRNMISKSRWKLLAMLALVLVVMVWYSISREDSFYFPIPEKKEPCFQGEAERKASKLFGNYSRDQPIFLQLKDYFWVKTPSAYELPYGTKGSEDLLLRVLAITSYSIPESIQSLKCRRCVVVGNGHRLRNSSLGDAINKYDVVIRLNNAPVAGYEGDVGSKTTMRLFYPESAHFNPKVENDPDTLLVLVAFKAMDFHWIETILSDKKRVRKGFWKQPPLIWDVNPRQVRILNPFFMEIAADKLLSLPMQQPRKIKQVQKPTTGLLAITLALHLCDLVHIAGFGYPDAHNRKQTIHYYEQITLKSMAGSGHNVSQEALAIKRMLEMGAVKNLTFF
ncbi:CMP-N-acetylneuraminate-beta-galactosamide-alpha-2,3-sialyltransferase 4 isoform X3 [Mirounga leonina]|uniref:CMP-N-acetylneuraminate-beta-galactosamide- alpha-2,3-sialyltransferase 4 isoform X3 n=2 Tax=Mirounga TaxID=9714 RepID=UPI00156C44BE|nr:CMP-N-acetylneuraminate-beta-galactosamide-alpha-2,3-sialyltransferase 4 isoform X3 [Mirounga leonina]